MMRFRKSIRWRLQAWYGALLLAMVAGFCVTAYRLERTHALRQLDQELDLRLGILSASLSRGGRPGDGGPPGRERPRRFDDDGMQAGMEDDPPPEDRPPPDGEGSPFQSAEISSLFDTTAAEPFYFQIWTRKNTLLARTETSPQDILRPEPPAGSAPDRQTRDRRGVRESFHFTPPGECLLVGKSTAAFERSMRELALKLAGIGGLVWFAGLAGGAWISTRALRPIEEIGAAATRIARGDLKQRIQTAETESELGRLAAVLDETFQKLDHAFDEQARFTSDAAHELRTPVSIVLAQCQLALARERGPEEYRDAIRTTQRAARRMHGLIEALLQLSVLDGAPDRIASAECDLSQIAREQAEALRPLAEAKGLRLSDDCQPARCQANAAQIEQVAANLLTNAIKFCEDGSAITIATGTTVDGVEMSVSDTGPGISTEHLPHLFERFYRTDHSRSRESGGAGLGLAICQRIAKAHGGEIGVQSKVGEGTVFTLKLPLEKR